MDEIEVRPGKDAELQDRYREWYFPQALARGMTFEFGWRTPVARIPERSCTLYFVWSVPGPSEWWGMRIGNDEAKANWWRSVDELIVSRQRKFLSDAGLEALPCSSL